MGPTHDDVTIEGVARAIGLKVVRHPQLVELLERYYKGAPTEAHLKMAEVPSGAELISTGRSASRSSSRNVYVLPGVPEIFRQKFEALRERFRDEPIHLKNVFVLLGEGTLADHLNALLRVSRLLLGSYPEVWNPEYPGQGHARVARRGVPGEALAAFLEGLPGDAVVKVT